MKFLYHATNVDFSRFSLDVGWRGREYGAGIYLINDIQHIKDFYDKEQKKELQTRVSVNNLALGFTLNVILTTQSISLKLHFNIFMI